MEPPQQLYDQSATHFRLRLYVRGESEVHGRLVLDLAEFFLSNLLFPGTHLKALNTKRPGMGYRLNMGAFTASRWKAAQKKILSGDYAVLGLDAETPGFPNQKIWFNSHVNPPGRDELLSAGTIEVMCSVSYLRHIAATPVRVEAFLEIARRAWNGVDQAMKTTLVTLAPARALGTATS